MNFKLLLMDKESISKSLKLDRFTHIDRQNFTDNQGTLFYFLFSVPFCSSLFMLFSGLNKYCKILWI